MSMTKHGMYHLRHKCWAATIIQNCTQNTISAASWKIIRILIRFDNFRHVDSQFENVPDLFPSLVCFIVSPNSDKLYINMS